jgi:hypothetical protein
MQEAVAWSGYMADAQLSRFPKRSGEFIVRWSVGLHFNYNLLYCRLVVYLAVSKLLVQAYKAHKASFQRDAKLSQRRREIRLKSVGLCGANRAGKNFLHQ